MTQIKDPNSRKRLSSAASLWLRHHDKGTKRRKKGSVNLKAAKFKRWQRRQQKTGAASPVRHIDPQETDEHRRVTNGDAPQDFTDR